ncbi:MAG TPA: hypothetical protein VFZ83_03420 [Acidimicrobiia bacterium]|nr:hypothetical protein [Acidimicrobiia bacterium]
MAGRGRIEHPGRVLLMGALLLVGVNLAVLAGTEQSNDDGGAELPSAIERLLPEPGAVIRPQDDVGVDLRDDLQGQLTIDPPDDQPVTISPEQYGGDPNLGLYTYRPAPDSEFREFAPGDHVVIAEFWPRTLTYTAALEADRLGSYSWSFRVG